MTFDLILNFVQTHILPLGGIGVFFASIFEEIVAPIPSTVVIFGAGLLFISGPVDLEEIIRLFAIVVFPAAAGVTLGSLFVYGIAYYAGRPILLKWGKWLGLSWGDVEKLQEKFAKGTFDDWALLFLRAIPILPSVAISAFCGLVRFPIKPYLICTFLGTAVKATFLGLAAWQFGELYADYAKLLLTSEKIVLGFVVIVLILFMVGRFLNSKRQV